MNIRGYNEAVQCQDACNLTAVVNALSRHCHALHDSGADTMTVRNDPAVKLFIGKLCSLANVSHDLEYCELYEKCAALV